MLTARLEPRVDPVGRVAGRVSRASSGCPFSNRPDGPNSRDVVSIVVPTFQRPEALARLLRSTSEIHYPFVEIIVVNCAAEPLHFSPSSLGMTGVTVIEQGTESLPSRARNQGAKAASGRFLFFLDDDNVVDRESVCWLACSLASGVRLGLAAPIVFYLHGDGIVWSAGISRGRISSVTTFPGRGSPSIHSELLAGFRPEDFPDAYMVPSTVFAEIGGYDDERFPIHYEESDLCRRIREAGYRLKLVSEAAVWHDLPPPGSSEERARQHHVHSPLRAYYAGRNRIIFAFRHEREAFPAFLLLFLLPLTMYYMVVIGSGGVDSAAAARAYLRGVYEGLRYAHWHRVES